MSEPRIQWVQFVVEQQYEGLRLDRYLTKKLRGLSRTRVQELITEHLRAERPLKPSSTVHAGLSFAIKRERDEEPETPRELPEIFRDEHLLVLDKPAGLPIHPTARYELGTLVGRLREIYGDGYAAPAHRLDRETSGVMVCSRTLLAAQRLMAAFSRGRVEKEYLAICEGTPPDEFEVDAPIAVGSDIVRIAVRVDYALGRPSQTRFVVVRRFERDGEPFALLRAFPKTGRQHQIRVHLREAHFPLVGDKIYGASETIYDRFVKHALTPDDWATLRLPRQALHAATIRFTHPGTGEPVTFDAPLPKDLVDFIA